MPSSLKQLVYVAAIAVQAHAYMLPAPPTRSLASRSAAPLMAEPLAPAELLEQAATSAPVSAPSSARAPAPAKLRKPEPTGLFVPLVLGAKRVMGTKELNALRAQVISLHSKVIGRFVDTYETPFGQLALRRLFAAADKDRNGMLDKSEVRDALHALGFGFLGEKQVDGIVTRADADENGAIDFDEFVREAPRTLRTNLIKLAKQNGHELGFLA